jgi:hypothetical protein
MRRSLIDDVVYTDEVDELGPPIVFENAQIRRMLRLAEAGESDVFYDLGSGWGQNLIIAATEFGVQRAIGFEKDDGRFRRSARRIKRLSAKLPETAKRIRVLQTDFLRLPERGRDSVRLSEATIVFLGLDLLPKEVEGLLGQLRDGCRLVYHNCSLIPEIMPDKADFPFFVSVKPFRRPRSELEWLSAVVPKPNSSLHKGKPDAVELWDELAHDSKVSARYNLAPEYKRRIRKLLG